MSMSNGTDPELLEPMKKLHAAAKKLHKALLSIDVVVKNLKNLLPFSTADVRKVRGALYGGLTRPTARRIRDVQDSVVNVGEAIRTLEITVRKKTRRSPLSSLIRLWDKNKVRTYSNGITRYLSLNADGRIMKCINQKEFDITDKDILALYDWVTAFLTLSDSIETNAELLESNYKLTGVSSAAF
jgi:uncharacterized protein Yka (UPF0111/DUF47 family)